MSFLDTLIFGVREVYAAGVELTRRPALDFGAGLTAVDNPMTGRTDITASGGGSGTTEILCWLGLRPRSATPTCVRQHARSI
jgi:hypothetical protein